MNTEALRNRTWLSLILVMASTVCGAGSCLNGLPSQQTPFDKLLTAGIAAEKDGDLATAEKDFQDAAHAAEVKYGKDDARVATCLTSLGQLYRQESEYLKARNAYNELIAILEKTAPGSADLNDRKSELDEIQSKIKQYNLDGSGGTSKSISGEKDKNGLKPPKKKHK